MQFSIIMHSLLKPLMFFVPVLCQAFGVVAETWNITGKGSGFQVRSIPGCFFVPMQICSDHLCVQALRDNIFQATIGTLILSPQAAGAYSSHTYITTKGHSWIPCPPTSTKSRYILNDFLCLAKLTVPKLFGLRIQ